MAFEYSAYFNKLVDRLRSIPLYIIARIVLGLIMVVIGISYFYRPMGVFNRFEVYGPMGPITLALAYTSCGSLMAIFNRHNWTAWLIMPNYMYTGMLLYLTATSMTSWSTFIYSLSFLFFANVAIIRGEVSGRKDGRR